MSTGSHRSNPQHKDSQTQRRRRCIIQWITKGVLKFEEARETHEARDEGKLEKDTRFGRGRVSVTVPVGFLRAQALGISNSSTNPREAAFVMRIRPRFGIQSHPKEFHFGARKSTGRRIGS